MGNIGIANEYIVFANDSTEDVRTFMAMHGDGLKVIDGRGFVAMPGLVNLHNHAAMTLMRGYADDMPLMPWLEERIWPFEAKMDGTDIYRGAKLGIAEMLLGGTTTVADMYANAEHVARAAGEISMRAVLAPVFFDNNIEAFERDFDRLAEKYCGAEDSLITLRIGPHAPYTCSPETIRRGLRYCEKYGVGIHTHLSETLDEVATVRERYGKSPVQYLDDLGIFDYPALAAHCVHVSEDDMEIMARRGVSVSHNPQSNMKLASGIAPVVRMQEMGANVGLGTDGPSSNNDLDMWEEMRSASFLQKVTVADATALPAYRVLQMATSDGARALGMSGKIGIVEKGARADLILVNLGAPHFCPGNDLIADLVYCGKASDVDTVIVDGKILVEGGKLRCADLEAICHDARQSTEAVKKRIKVN